MIVRTEAVVLHSLKYGESSLIVSLYTREHGKLSVIAKGARQTRSRFGGTLQPASHIQAVYYHKPGRSIQVLTESSHVQLFNGTGRNMEKMAAALRIVELVSALMQESEQNPSVFNLIRRCLEELDRADARTFRYVLPFFRIRLASLMGFAPDIDRDDVLRVGEEGGVLVVENGTILPSSAATAAGIPSSRAVLRAFAICARARMEHALALRLTRLEKDDLEAMSDAYLRYHLPDIVPGRAEKVLRNFKTDEFDDAGA